MPTSPKWLDDIPNRFLFSVTGDISDIIIGPMLLCEWDDNKDRPSELSPKNMKYYMEKYKYPQHIKVIAHRGLYFQQIATYIRKFEGKCEMGFRFSHCKGNACPCACGYNCFKCRTFA